MTQVCWKPQRNCYRAEFELDLPPGAGFMFRSSNNMTPLLVSSNVFWPPAFEGEYPSQDVIVVGDVDSRQYVLAGAVTAHRSLTYFSLLKRGRFKSILVKQPDILDGDTPEELVVLKGDDWRKLLFDYARIAAAKMKVPAIAAEKNLTGYCTWYYYYADVTEADFLENLRALEMKKNSPYSAAVVQIDDGYQSFQGDWLDQDASWPTPLAEIGRRINAAGMRAGIWTMPLLASTASRVYREHPDWFVKKENGEVLEIHGWSPPPDHLWVCLDATQEAVREHLAKVFKTFRSWGFSYFKMDGLGFGLPQGVRQDRNATAVSAFRQALGAIREAVPDATLLGCCPPFLACLGLVDNCRVSPDTGRYWYAPSLPLNCEGGPTPGIASALHSTVSNFWMYDTWFRADPDTLMARQDNAYYTEGEARISVLTGILTGVAITSDHLGRIATERLDLLGKAARYRLRHARPLEWASDRWPQIFEGTIDGRRGIALINDAAVPVTYDFAKLGLTGEAEELLQGLGKVTGQITLEPHDAALLIQS